MPNSASPSPPARADTLTVAAAQLQSHLSNGGPSTIASVLTALAVLALLRDDAPPARLWSWVAALLLVRLLRLALQRAHRRATAGADRVHGIHGVDGAADASWLRRYRATAALHGLVWGALALLPADVRRPDVLAPLLMVLGGLVAGAMTLSTSDLRAATLFVAPALLPLYLRLAGGAAPLPALALVGGMMIVLLIVLSGIAAARVQRERQALAAARQAEAEGVADAHRAEGLLKMIFEHIGEGISIFDRELKLVAWNQQFSDFTRLHSSLLYAGAPLRECLLSLAHAGEFGPLDDIEAEVTRRLGELMSPAASVLERERPDGHRFEMRRSPMPDGGVIIVYVDVTQRRASEAALLEQQRMLSLLLANTEEGFWFIDNAQRTTDANPAMCRMLGVTREQMLGRTIYDFVDADNEKIFRHHVAQRALGQAGSYEITLRRADGGAMHCYNNATPIFDAAGAKVGAVGLFSNISEQKRVEAQARQAGELLAQKSHVLEVTLQSLSQGVLNIDAQGRSHAWNRRFLELLEIPETFMQTRPTLPELAHFQMQRLQFGEHLAQMDDTGREALARFLAGDLKSIARQYQRTRADGTVIDVESHFADDGSLVRTFTDVTASVYAQRLLRESETRFRTMADAAPALIWLSGEDGAPVWFNQRWLNHVGRTLDDELKTPWRERMHADDYERCYAAFTQALADRSAYDIEFRLRRADGHWGWIADTGIPSFGPAADFEGFISYGWDISERKAAEAELIAARDEAERANRAKSEFLSRMSHELRTPLNAILGFAQLMASDRSEPLGETQRGRVHELMHGGRHLLSLINEVLDLARIEAGTLKLRLRPVDVGALVADCLRLVQPVAQARRIELSPPEACEGAGHVLADATRLRQVLLNLLSNAIKYNHEGGHVTVSCHEEAQTLRIDVRDGGPGISATQQQRLFQAFERLGADRTAVEGAGIGLALSKWLVDLMHGEIGVISERARGSTFWVRLTRSEARSDGVTVAVTAPMPLLPEPAVDVLPAAPAAPARPPAPRRRTVLYIEDNPVNQVLMEGMLAHRPDVRLLVAGLPAQGLTMAEQARPDLVLLDIQLPGMDGFEVLRRLRQQPATERTPVIAVSANAMQSDIDDARRAGFDDYVTKPLDMHRLLAVVDTVLR